MKKRRDVLIFFVWLAFVIGGAVFVDKYPGTFFGDVLLVVMLVVGIAFILYGVYLLIKMFRSSKKQKASRLKRYGAAMSGTLKHISGLPIAKGLTVDMFYGPEKSSL